MKEKISVLIPTYNVEKYIEESVYSVVNQTYTDLEIIIVDDCSSDGTFEILKRISLSDPRIRLFQNKKNLKIVETLNFALLQSTGSYIARMDGDDISMPDRIEKQLQFLKEFPEYDLVGSNTITIDEDGNELGRTKMLSNENLINKTLLLSSPVLHIWLVKKEVYIKLKGYRIPTVEDYDFLLRMKTAGLKFTNIDEYLYKVRIREGNTVTSNGLIQRRCFNYIRKLYKERLKFKKDSFSEKDLSELFNPSKFKREMYRFSALLMNKAVNYKHKSYFLAITFAFLSVFFSIYRFQEFYFRIKKFFIIRCYG